MYSKILITIRVPSQAILKVIRAFFKEYNAKNDIKVAGEEVSMELYFENEPPLSIFDELTEEVETKLVELKVVKVGTEIPDMQSTCQKPEPSDSEQLTIFDVEIPEQVQEPQHQKINENKADEKQPGHEEVQKHIDATEKTENKIYCTLDSFAENSSSFDEFLDKCTEWLHMCSKSELFKQIILISCKSGKFSLSYAKKHLREQGVDVTKSAEAALHHKITQKMKELGCDLKLSGIAELIISRYSKYNYGSNENYTDTAKSGRNEESLQHSDSETVPGMNTEAFPMKCIPETPKLKQAFVNMSKMHSIEEKIKLVLDAMGLNEEPDGELILKTVCKAIERDNIDDYYVTVSPGEIMALSRFLNRTKKHVRGIDFLKELKVVIS